MNRIHIIGRKNSGKTTLITELVRWFTSQGYRVATVKHTHHHHELDTPGKDSHRHREAGAAVVGILSPTMSAVFVPAEATQEDADRYTIFSAVFDGCDIAIVEGDSQTQAPKIEVWRAASGSQPLVADDPTILAVVTDDPLDIAATIHARGDVPRLASWILSTALGIAPRSRQSR